MAEKKVEATEAKETTTVEGGKSSDTKVEVTVTTKAKGDEERISEDTDLVTETVTEDGEYKPLFDEEAELTEADLTGEEEKTPEEEVKAEDDKTTEQPADKKAEEEKQAAKESEEKKLRKRLRLKLRQIKNSRPRKKLRQKRSRKRPIKNPPMVMCRMKRYMRNARKDKHCRLKCNN